jgi:hypothetical protein
MLNIFFIITAFFGVIYCNGLNSRWSNLHEYWFDQTLDHFNFRNTDTTFRQRFYVDKTHFKPNSTILFYTGNEASIDVFINNTGILFELAPKLDAMVVFAEHRFYGQRYVLFVNQSSDFNTKICLLVFHLEF